ncbi:MAG: glycosyl transferase [Cytophagales bacterium]|jgi:uncharacterized protein (TIGR00661 family)|nr:glycosyl transferase [Cytophagales bacterium]
MKILYAIQGTGNGHISRARDIIPILQTKGELDLLVSGTQADVSLPYDIKYRLGGLSFVFGKKGGVDLYKTFKQAKSKRFVREIRSVPVESYDLVINDFEPVSAWACRLRKKACIGVSHQAAVLSPHAPQPDHTDLIGKMVLQSYAPVTTAYGFHFQAYDDHTYTPVIRREVRQWQSTDEGHYTVYLPAYDDDHLLETLGKLGEVRWDVFSKHCSAPREIGNVSIQPVSNEAFVQSLTTCTGILCGAGFETPAEALFLKKKVMVVPMKNQYEQHCNAAALAHMGVPVIKKLKKKHLPAIKDWIRNGQVIPVDYPDQTEQVIDRVIAEQTAPQPPKGERVVLK